MNQDSPGLCGDGVIQDDYIRSGQRRKRDIRSGSYIAVNRDRIAAIGEIYKNEGARRYIASDFDHGAIGAGVLEGERGMGVERSADRQRIRRTDPPHAVRAANTQIHKDQARRTGHITKHRDAVGFRPGADRHDPAREQILGDAHHVLAGAGVNGQRPPGSHSADDLQLCTGRACGLQRDVSAGDDIAFDNIEGLGGPTQPCAKINQNRTGYSLHCALDFNGIGSGSRGQGRVAPCGHNPHDRDRIRPLIALDQQITARHQVFRNGNREFGQPAGFDRDVSSCQDPAISKIKGLHSFDLGVAKVQQHRTSHRMDALGQADHILAITCPDAHVPLRLQQPGDRDAVIAASCPDIDVAACS